MSIRSSVHSVRVTLLISTAPLPTYTDQCHPIAVSEYQIKSNVTLFI